MSATAPSPTTNPSRGRCCAICGDRLGVYEPIVYLAEQGAVCTSIAANPALAEPVGIGAGSLFHAACHALRSSRVIEPLP